MACRPDPASCLILPLHKPWLSLLTHFFCDPGGPGGCSWWPYRENDIACHYLHYPLITCFPCEKQGRKGSWKKSRKVIGWAHANNRQEYGLHGLQHGNSLIYTTLELLNIRLLYTSIHPCKYNGSGTACKQNKAF